MSMNRLLDPANSIEELEEQLGFQEVKFAMEVLSIGMFQTDEVSPEKANFVNITSHLGNKLPGLHVQPVDPDVAADEEKFSAFYDTVMTGNTFVDSTIVLIAGVEQQIIAFRNGVSAAPVSPIPQPGADSAPNLPDYVVDILSAAKGMPWSKSVSLPAMDAYLGMMPGRCRLFQNLTGPQNKAMNAFYYECKLDIDNDGSGGNAAGDRFHQSDTSLHDPNGRALDASTIAFAVLPLDRSERRAKRPGLPDFGHDLGLKLGDVGVAFWRRGPSGPVRSVPFIYGDKGPANKIGEGSVHMADALGINSDPNRGGIDPIEMKQLKKGIIHVAFPGSGTAFLVAGNRVRSTLIPNQIEARAKLYFDSLLRQPAPANH